MRWMTWPAMYAWLYAAGDAADRHVGEDEGGAGPGGGLAGAGARIALVGWYRLTV